MCHKLLRVNPAQARSFAIDVSRAEIPPRAPDEMGWTQTRTLQRAALCPIAHLPHQPVAQPQDFLQPVCAQNIQLELEIMATPWLSDIPSCAGSALAQAPVPCRTLCTTLCGFPGASFGKPSCQLRLGQSLYSFLSHYNKCLDNQPSSASS